MKRYLAACVALACLSLAGGWSTIEARQADPGKPGMTDAQLAAVRDGFDRRVAQAFDAERGKPLVRAAKRPPLRPGRGNYVRHYSWSIVDFATRCFLLNEQNDQANAALVENAQYYLDHPDDVKDQDSFHWHSEMLCRLIEMYGAKGSVAPGRMAPKTEQIIMEQLWLYVNTNIAPYEEEVKTLNTWRVLVSDNHHTMDFVTKWHFAKLAKANPAFRDRKYHDGSTAADQYGIWTKYIKAYCTERAKKGLFIEVGSDNYNVVGTKGFHNIYDFADDPVLKERAKNLLDLHWAVWAQEQIDGVRGGGRNRISPAGKLEKGAR